MVAFSCRRTLPYLPRTDRQPSDISFFFLDRRVISGLINTWSGSSDFFGAALSIGFWSSVMTGSNALPAMTKIRSGSPTCGAANATPKSSPARTFFIWAISFAILGEVMSLWATGSAFWRSTGSPSCTTGSLGTLLYYPYGAYRQAHGGGFGGVQSGARYRARRDDEVLYGAAQPCPRARRLRAADACAHGAPAGRHPHQRPLLFKKRVRPVERLFQKILVGDKAEA